MKTILITPIVIVILFYLLFGEFDMTITNNKVQHEYKFNGIVWVALDLYSIKKYNSKDEPKKIFKYTKTNLPI